MTMQLRFFAMTIKQSMRISALKNWAPLLLFYIIANILQEIAVPFCVIKQLMNAEIIAIGTELLLGFVVNTDTVFLSRMLAELGIDCYHQVTVGDNRQRLKETLRTALHRADLVITCGGLGPTVDDITLETISEATGHPLVLLRPLLKQIRSRFSRLNIRMPESNVRQAMIPRGAVILPNRIGTAPGFLLKLRINGADHTLAALPGPPAELMPMAKQYLLPKLKRFTGDTVIRSRTLKTTGLTESEVDARVADILALKGAVTVGIYAHPSQVDLRITAKAAGGRTADRLVSAMEKKIRRRLGNLIFGADDETLEGVVGKLLKKKSLTLSAAESCTGGLVGHRLTEVAGSSDYFLGGVISYSNNLKESALGVPKKTLKKYGAVSPQTARAMADSVRQLTSADLGLSLTGIAGPTGGTKTKPVGLVYIALSMRRKTSVARCRFSGKRSLVKFRASQKALNTVRLHLLSGR